MDFGVWHWLLFIGGGMLAGVINTLAGNGSAITLTLLLATGMDANVANATNRVGVLLQTLTSVVSLKRSARTYHLIKHSTWYFLPTAIGSLIGAFVAVDIDENILENIIGIFMFIILGTLILQPKKWLIATDAKKNRKTVLNWILMFAIGFYGGFIQMGIGIMMLAALVLSARFSLKDANIIKLVLAFVLILIAFVVYLFSGDIVWIPGLALAIGAMIGAWFGTRYVLYHPKANDYIRYVLIAIILFAIYNIYFR